MDAPLGTAARNNPVSRKGQHKQIHLTWDEEMQPESLKPVLTFVSIEVDLHSRISTGVKDLPGVNLDNGHSAGARGRQTLSLL